MRQLSLFVENKKSKRRAFGKRSALQTVDKDTSTIKFLRKRRKAKKKNEDNVEFDQKDGGQTCLAGCFV